MTAEQALKLLELEDGNPADEESIVEHYEDKIWMVRDYLLRNPIVPAIFRKKLDETRKVHKALTVLLPRWGEEAMPVPYEIRRPENIDEALSNYQVDCGAVKLMISNAPSVNILAPAVEALIAIQHNLEGALLHHFSWFAEDPAQHAGRFNAEVKISRPEDILVLKKAVREANTDEAQMYICLTEVYRILKAQNLKVNRP